MADETVHKKAEDGAPNAADQAKRGNEGAPVKAREGQKNPAEGTENPEIPEGQPAWWQKLKEALEEEAQRAENEDSEVTE